jgi:hypothetical protein
MLGMNRCTQEQFLAVLDNKSGVPRGIVSWVQKLFLCRSRGMQPFADRQCNSLQTSDANLCKPAKQPAMATAAKSFVFSITIDRLLGNPPAAKQRYFCGEWHGH